MIRILHYGLSNNLGGIESYLYKILENIDKSEFQFDFIDTTTNGHPYYYDEFISSGCKFHKITNRRKSIIKNKLELEKLFKQETFDIFHCHLNTLSYIDPIKIALKHGCKVIVHSRSGSVPDSILTKVLHYIHFRTLPKKKIKAVAVSKLAGEWLFGKEHNVLILNNGINIGKYMFRAEYRIETRQNLNVNENFVIGHIGTFSYPKNHKFLIDVFYHIQQMQPDARLILIGEGPLKNEIINYTKQSNILEKVIFLNRREDIPELLCAMDCFLFPSLYEGFPNTVLEAQTSGLPCFISDRITNEIHITDTCRRISLNNTPESWASEIVNTNLDVDRSSYLNIIKSSGFSVEDEITRLEKLYYDLLQ